MNKNEFKELVKDLVFLDGATGTNLTKAGMPAGVQPEKWILDNPEILKGLQKEFFDAGSNIVLAPTFTANRIKLSEYGLEDDIVNINKRLVEITKAAREESINKSSKKFIAADISMTGKQLKPLGNMDFEELVDIYKEQISILAPLVDLIFIETMMSLEETRAALIAARETCELPVLCSLTFDESGRTLYGTDPKTAMAVLQSLSADAVGCNCSVGPDKLLKVIEEMAEIANVPIIAKPNAGLPILKEDKSTGYSVDPLDFTDEMLKIIKAGAGIIGGCCGTEPAHIRTLIEACRDLKPQRKDAGKKRYLSSSRRTLVFDLDSPFMVVGERINPTGKKKLQEELRNSEFNMVHDFAIAQEEGGASLLDINVGMGGIDEKETLKKAIEEVSMAVNLPLVIDSSNIEAMEAALRLYPGRALVNSISLESKKIDELLPIVKKYGAMFILLPLSDEGLPKDLSEKKSIILKVIEKAKELGFTDEDIIVDGLVQTVGANSKAGLETLDTIRFCHDELKLPTICGLSNISFGLPERINVNTAFLDMAIMQGLTMAIMNPSQTALVSSAFACDLLLDKEGADIRYIDYVNSLEKTEVVKTVKSSKPLEKAAPDKASEADEIFECVLSGSKNRIIDKTKDALSGGRKAKSILDESLIPAINEVGKLFESGRYFLPQLIKSAEAMSASIALLEPLLKEDKDDKISVTIVIATVKGDIHDIGKNLVALMLKNYGFNVIDLGKDVPGEDIIAAAEKYDADIIALSALMTTTMTQMETVVNMAREKKLKAKIIIGGAVTTGDYCELIGADGHSKDAQEAVILVQKLMKLIS
ncbi:MAG: homocysteine S-methyltransferase family protein [Lachnospiraceae bacterium]|nr:homocysteine S-methyltransferase family protein [Lachnospiraceae bacterium]